MAVLSTLKRINWSPLKSALFNVSVRSAGGHARQMVIRPTNYAWRSWKDNCHWYFMLGLIPLTIITTLANVIVGPAELAEIPEGYEPYHWEYYKSPISRFIARYMIRDKRIDHEMMVSRLNEDAECRVLVQIENYVKTFMSLRSDYKSWYYRPVSGYLHRYDREMWKEIRDRHIGGHSWYGDEDHFSDGGQPYRGPDGDN